MDGLRQFCCWVSNSRCFAFASSVRCRRIICCDVRFKPQSFGTVPMCVETSKENDASICSGRSNLCFDCFDHTCGMVIANLVRAPCPQRPRAVGFTLPEGARRGSGTLIGKVVVKGLDCWAYRCYTCQPLALIPLMAGGHYLAESRRHQTVLDSPPVTRLLKGVSRFIFFANYNHDLPM